MVKKKVNQGGKKAAGLNRCTLDTLGTTGPRGPAGHTKSGDNIEKHRQSVGGEK